MVYDGTSMWDKPGTSKPKSDPKPDPKPKKPYKPTPQGGRGGGQGNPTNKRGSGFPESKDTYYQSKGELLSEATKLGHFEPDILDVDIKDISTGMGLDERIGERFLRAGPAYGGSCFPKDTRALIDTGKNFKTDLTIVKTVVKSNENRKKMLTKKIHNILGYSF